MSTANIRLAAGLWAILAVSLGWGARPAIGQVTSPPDAAAPADATPANPQPDDPLVTETSDKVAEIAEQVDKDPRAQEASAGILQPIYQLAEKIAHPAFHWIAFALFATGAVSYALQIVLAKLAVLMRGSLSFKEILSDVLGLVISLMGLVLTTQAAAENSTFTTRPAAVLSASAVGVIVGFVFYLWGQSQELQAAKGRKVE